MNEKSHKSLEQAESEGKYIRKVKSFVKREGRLTKGQASALERLWPTMGLNHENGMLDLGHMFSGKEVCIEIGFGMGKSLVEMSGAAPNTGFIGIEVHRPGVGACLSTAEEAGVENLKVFEHDAVEVLADCIPDASVSKVFLFFPDPWHKKRHHKRRIVQPEFIESIRNKLKTGGHFHMATDWENYAEHMLEEMSQAPGFKNTSPNGDFVARPDYRPITKFETRGQRLGHGVWDLIFEKLD